ncbi:MFS transporter [Muricauda sp. 2012CJ35-5]|uniref:MFS transporter n=1 Tax=Flagellimonas spongiicola TaxID=2942208 RepID=A0ABT0PPG9_9FLAO|nr:MFS transporter [Allomuricauda spongiicola]MCL6273293.1 MFS transporter [Allomuricauda spongiicola]
MGIIKNQKLPKETLYFSLSRMLESASFYGLRALLVLYMIAGVLKMDDTQAILVYGWFSGSIIFSQVLGATLGDLLIGNKKSIIIGGLVQSAGAFILCLPSSYGLYIGLFLIVLGTGLFTPNIIANYGKSYLKSTQLLDAGFTLFFLVINIGSFIGILLIGYSGEKFGYTIGFIISGLLTLLSLIPILKTKENEFHQRDNVPFERRILNIVIALLIVGLFWGIYEISSFRIVDLQLKFSEISLLEISKSAWQSMSSIFVVPICLIAIIIWTYFYSSQFFKLLVGFISGAIAFGIILFIPEVPAANHTIYFFLALLFLAISEIHIAPIIHSILTKYSNPKYLAILISLAFVPPKLFALFFGLFNERLYDNPTLGIKLGTIAMVLVSIGLVGFIIIDKKRTPNIG